MDFWKPSNTVTTSVALNSDVNITSNILPLFQFKITNDSLSPLDAAVHKYVDSIVVTVHEYFTSTMLPIYL